MTTVRDQSRAIRILNKAVKKGIVIRPDHCLFCGSGGRIEAHHIDYSDPLNVLFLCICCHRAQHRKSKQGIGIISKPSRHISSR